MRRLDVGRIVKTIKSVDDDLPKGAICRVVKPWTGGEVLVQAALGTLSPNGAAFEGHNGDGAVRKRGWYVPRYAIRSTRDKVANAREFAARFGK